MKKEESKKSVQPKEATKTALKQDQKKPATEEKVNKDDLLTFDEHDEEITFLGADVDEPRQEKQKPISYRILYDKESKTWEVRKDQAKRVIRRVKTKKEALEYAQELSQKQDLNLVVHKKDGKFQKKR